MNRASARWTLIAAMNMALAVAIGAFGAHGLKQIVTPDRLATYEIGVKYHFYHALGLFVIAWLANMPNLKGVRAAGIALLIGIVLFSGSLYLFTFQPEWSWLGPVTPLGGLSFIVGWLLAARAAITTL